MRMRTRRFHRFNDDGPTSIVHVEEFVVIIVVVVAAVVVVVAAVVVVVVVVVVAIVVGRSTSLYPRPLAKDTITRRAALQQQRQQTDTTRSVTATDKQQRDSLPLGARQGGQHLLVCLGTQPEGEVKPLNLLWVYTYTITPI